MQMILSSLELHIYSLDMVSMLRLRYVLIDKVAYFVCYHQICVVLRFFFACRRNRKLILASYHDYYNFTLRVTYVAVTNGCVRRENCGFESGN
jgi:hypothetical protein